MRKFIVVRRKSKIRVKSRSLLQIQHPTPTGGFILREYPLRDIDALLVIGRNHYIESSAFSVLASSNIPVAVIAKNSVAIAYNPVITITYHYRALQYRLPKTDALQIAQVYIRAKIEGMKNILRYYRKQIPPLAPPPEPGETPHEYEQKIRLWESKNSNLLWDRIPSILKPPHLRVLVYEYGFPGRKPRHPDPFNKTLSVMYAVIYSLATRALLSVGLDPTYGFLHRTRYNVPLTYDFTEMFKPVAIHSTLDLINRHGVPELASDGELTRDSINKAIRHLYEYLTMKHRRTKRTIYSMIYLKAYHLAKHLENNYPRNKLAYIWNRIEYTRHR